MSSLDCDHQSILIRLKSLEAQNRILRLLFISLIVLVTTIGCAELQSLNFSNPSFPDDKILEIEQLIIKDNNGDVRIKIDASDSANIKQSFYDEGGIERAQISIDEEGSARFRLYDTASSMRFSAVTFSDTHENASNNVALALLGQENEGGSLDKGGLYLTNTSKGSSYTQIVDNSGTVREASGTFEDGGYSHSLFNGSGLVVEQFGNTNKGSSYHNLSDSSGTIRYSYGVNEENGTYLTMYDKDGTIRQQSNVFDNEDKAVNQLILNSKGKIRLSNYNTLNGTGSLIYDNNNTIRESIASLEDGTYSRIIYDRNGTKRHSFNTFNNDTKNIANQLMYDENGTIRQSYYTSTVSGMSNKDSDGNTRTSNVIDEYNSLNYHVEKSATDKAWDAYDGIMRAIDLIDIFSGSQE